nr:ryncolin-1-like [Pocillopora verrucosa]
MFDIDVVACRFNVYFILKRMPLLQTIKIPCWILYSLFFTNYGCSQSNMCAIKPCSVKQYSFSRERNSVENHALYDHSFKNLTVQSHKDCFENCAWDCRCKSFNFVTRMKQKNCHLNEQDRYVEPGALKKTIGFSYHEIGIEYNIKSGTKCLQCHNGCCRGNIHCLNGGTCQETCDRRRFRCACRPGYTGNYCDKRVQVSISKSCAEIKKNGGQSDGVYTIDPDGKGAFQVYCYQNYSAGEPWAVIQRRMNGSVDFYRGWMDYKKGFGNVQGEFWLGLLNIHRLTNQRQHKMRIEIENFNGNWCWAEYENFTVSGEDDGFRLQSLGSYTGSCIDAFSYNVGAPFSTKDKDADSNANSNCAVDHQGAWWYKNCTYCNLNGKYNLQPGQEITGIYWYQNNGTPDRLIKWVEIKIQPFG